MDLEGYRVYLRQQVQRYSGYEKEDLEEGKNEAAYRAKIIKDAYADASDKLDKMIFGDC